MGKDSPLQGAQVGQMISDLGNEALSYLVSIEEVRGALWALGVDNVLGPDGFSTLFYRWY